MKKIVITIVAALALMGAVFGAAASLSVGGVDDLGSGGASVLDAIPDVDDVVWNLDDNDNSLVKGVSVTFALAGTTITGCSVTVQAGNSGDPDLGEFTSTGVSIDDSTPTVVTNTWTGSSIEASAIEDIDVTVIC